MNNIVYFIIFFSLLFGPKYNLIDTSIILPIIFYPLTGRAYYKLPRIYYKIFIMVIVLTAYQLIIQLLTENFDFESVGRLIRAILTIIITGFIFGSCSESDKIIFFKILIYAIVLHAILIIIAANFYQINKVLSLISGNYANKEHRTSGLLAGFDIAGYLSILCMAMILVDIHQSNSYVTRYIFMLILLLSCYYTSRISAVIGISIFFIFTVQFIKNSTISLFYRFFIGVFVSFILYRLIFLIMLTLDVTLSLGLFDVDDSVYHDILSTHAAVNDETYWTSMVIYPKSDFELLFGTGADFSESDIGYIKGIHRYGLLGLVFSIFIYLYFVIKNMSNQPSLFSAQSKLTIFIFILTLTLTFKNNYIFVRGAFPAFLIIISTITSFSKKNCLG